MKLLPKFIAAVVGAGVLLPGVAAQAAGGGVPTGPVTNGLCTPYYSDTTPPATIRVLSGGSVHTVDFKTYVKDVLPNEWVSSWPAESLKAGAIAAKTYAWYHVNHGRGQSLNGVCYDVDDSTNYQVYRQGSAQATTSAAIDATWNVVAHRNGSVFMTSYQRTLTGDPNEACGAAADGSKLSQYGSKNCADGGLPYQQILTRYYPGIELLNSSAPPPAATAVSSIALEFGGVQRYVARGTNGAVYLKGFTTGVGWGDWQSLGGDVVGQPIQIPYHGALEIFAVGVNGNLYQKQYDDGWSDWINLGGVLTGPVKAVVYHDSLQVFGVSTNGALYQVSYTSVDGWRPWLNLGGQLSDGPAVGLYHDTLQVVARGVNGAVYQLAYSAGWGTWTSLGGDVTGTPSLLVFNGAFQIYARSSGGAVYQRSFDGSNWSAWLNLGGTITGDPQAVVYNNQAQVYALSVNGAVYQSAYTGSWQPWTSLGGDSTGNPAVLLTGGSLWVFDRGVNGNLYLKYYQGGWSDWQNLAGDIT